jgi:hemoglobin
VTEVVPLFDRVGGAEFFVALVDRFYDGVADDDVLRPLYPDDLTDSKRWLALFLMQYWGGPGDYGAERGHPRLRMRHFPFRITTTEAERWWAHMKAAVESSDAAPAERAELLHYFESAATFLINSD